MKILFLFTVLSALFLSCSVSPRSGSSDNTDGNNHPIIAAANTNYIVFAWNDLGMHCLNPAYDTAVILPPYNTVWAQVIKRGAVPEIVTSNITVEYRIVSNTYSSGKTDSFGGKFAQFWQNAAALFGAPLAVDTGLNLKDPGIHNGLSGTMVIKDNDHFEADGIPLTPVDDYNNWNPYQVAEITVKDTNGNIIAQTRATVPTSDEINCALCHGTVNTFNNILATHDLKSGTMLITNKPVLCASCHGSPALGQSGPGSSGKYLSEAIHYFHATNSAAVCINCHPGNVTKCSRSLSHTASDGNCTSCHGSLTNVGLTIAGGRTPWLGEPKCAYCHKSGTAPASALADTNAVSVIAEVDTGSVLYRNARGHGNMYCASCHGSPHAMVPTSKASDNYQALQYQNKALSIGSCKVCHNNSKGNGAADFMGQHGSASPEEYSSCNVCHTSIPSGNTAQWPHQFQWYAR